MKKKMLVGIILGVLLFYLSFRGISVQAITDGLAHVRYSYVIPALLIMVFMQVLRSLRWGAILRPLEKINPLSLFGVTCVGFLAIAAIPARIGELARPYLITKKSHINITSALGTILIERLADILTLMSMLAGSLVVFTMPSWLIKPSILFFALTITVAGAVVFMITARERSVKILGRLLATLPDRYAAAVSRLVNQLIDGFEVVKQPKCLLSIIFYSVLIWSVNIVCIYLMFLAFRFDLSILAAFVLMVVLMVGIAIPTAPGFVGNWHFFCILALSLFGIAKPDALTFAVVYHFLSIGVITILGLIFLPFHSFSLSDLKRGSGKPDEA
jgi:glycosyltransferase 2 family protein